MRVARIVFMQGDDGREVVDALTRADGVVHYGATSETIGAAIEHLSQWDNGDDDDVHDHFAAGAGDNVVTDDETGYTLTFHVGLGYVGLERQLLDVWEATD